MCCELWHETWRKREVCRLNLKFRRLTTKEHHPDGFLEILRRNMTDRYLFLASVVRRVTVNTTVSVQDQPGAAIVHERSSGGEVVRSRRIAKRVVTAATGDNQPSF